MTFGRPWVERFCGPEAAQAIASNLSRQDSSELRAGLRDLYQAVFSAQGEARPAGNPYGVGQQVGCPVPEVFMSRLFRVGERGAGDGSGGHSAVVGTGPVRLPAWKRPNPVDDDRRGAGQFYVEVPLGGLGEPSCSGPFGTFLPRKPQDS